MSTLRVFCLDCGAELPRELPTGRPRPACKTCGSNRIDVHASSRVSGGGTATTSSESRSHNRAASRVADLRSAVAAARTAVDARSISHALSAVKRALEAIHELDDCRRRGEWSYDTWSPAEIGAWTAHIGARNAAHHHSWDAVFLAGGSAHSHTPAHDDLKWDRQIPAITSPHQASEYTSR